MAEKERPPPIRVGGRPLDVYFRAIAFRYGAGEKIIVLRARGAHIANLFHAVGLALDRGLILVPVALRSGEEPHRDRMVRWCEIELAVRAGSERGEEK